jgi:hypothetical protein
MEKLVLTTIGDIKHAELTSMFQSQGVAIVEREAHNSKTKELLFYCSPESYLAFFNVSKSDIVNKLAVWEKETLVQLDYVISNPERCLLIELEFAIQNPSEFNLYIKENLNIVLAENSIECFDATKQMQSCILLIDEDIQDTYEEIAAAADLYNKEGNQAVIERLSLYARDQQNKIDDKELLQVKHTEEIKKANAKCAKVEAELVNIKTEKEQNNVERAELNSVKELALLQINQLQEELETLFIEKEQAQALYAKEINEAENKVNDLTAKKAEFNSANELSLLQINQLQEELGTLFIEKQQVQALYAKEINESENKVNDLTAKKTALNLQNELGLSQINQLQEELEYYFMKLQNKKGQETTLKIPVVNIAQMKTSMQLVRLLK